MSSFKKTFLLFIFCFNFSYCFADGDVKARAVQIVNEMIEGNRIVLSELISANPDYKYESLMQLLNSGDSPELIAKSLEEFNLNISSNKKIISTVIASVEKNPEFIKRATASLKEVKAKLGLARISALTPSHCMLFIAAYFSTRDLSYSSRSFFTPGTKSDKTFVYKMDILASSMEMFTPVICLLDIASRKDEYKGFLKEVSAYKRSKTNIKHLKSVIKEFNSDPEALRKRKKQVYTKNLSNSAKESLSISVLEELEKREGKINAASDEKTNLLAKFKRFISSQKLKDLIKKYSNTLSPQEITLLKALNKNPEAKVTIHDKKLLEVWGNIYKSLEEDFLQDLVKNGEGTYAKLKDNLSKLKQENIKGLKGFDIPTSTKFCFSAIGGSMLIHGHLAAIGPDKTKFDNIEDKWLRENRNKFAYISVAAVSGTCFAKIPYFIYLKRMGRLDKTSLSLGQTDYRVMEQALENANARFRSGEKGKSSHIQKSSIANILARSEESIANSYGIESRLGDANITSEVEILVEELKGGENKLIKNLTTALNGSDYKLFSELLESRDPQYFSNLLEFLQNGDSQSAAEHIKNLKKNKFDIIKYLIELQNKVKNNPNSISKIEQNLINIKNDMKIKNIDPPSAQACMIAMGTYIGTRDLFFSIKNSYIEKELDDAWADTMDAADALTGLGIAYFCISDFIVHGKNYKDYFKSIGTLSGDKKQIQLLIDLTSSYRKDPKLKKIIKRQKTIAGLDQKKINEIAKAIGIKIQDKKASDFPDVKSAWKEFVFSGKIESIFNAYRKKLSLDDRIKLDLFLNKGSANIAEQEKTLLVINKFKEYLGENFEDWLKKSDSRERASLLKEFNALKQNQKKTLLLNKRPGLGSKACFWGVGTILAGLGYHAAVGNKPNDLDHDLEVEQRKKTHELFMGAQAIFAGTCGVNVIFSAVRKSRKIKDLRKRPFLNNTDRDWKMIENVLGEYDEKHSTDLGSGKKNRSRAKDMMLAISNKMNSFQHYTSDKVKDLKGARALKRKLNRETLKSYNLNFDKTCLENILKSAL